MGVGKMTEGRLFHTKHALGFGRERSREVASMSACIARSQRMPHRPCTTVLTPVVVITGFTFYEGVYPLPPPVFTGFKFSLIKTPLITGVKIPDHHSEPSPSRGWCGPQRRRTRPLERHAYKYPMGVGKMTEGRLFHTKHALDSGGNRSRR